MAESRKAGSSGNRCLGNRKRTRKNKGPEALSDSSSESNEDDSSSVLPAAIPPLSLKSSASPLTENSNDCPVCLQSCIHPARLPCGHVFCFLCLKGIAQQSRRCAMCRQEIAPDYLDRPDLLQVSETNQEKKPEVLEDGYQWFYEGRNGWWKFDERLSKDLEELHTLGIDKLETMICGTLYIIDIGELVQYNKTNPSRRRRIKRDLATNVVVKGVAGIR